MFPEYDAIVVGAGHAGCEAAAAAANMGSRVLLVTMNLQTIAQMSCNPAMGGIAKGQIVREIDALGGYSAIITDKSLIQFRMLNKSKGPAMWSPRAQSDRMLFAAEWRSQLEKIQNIDFYQDTVKNIIVKNKKAIGVITGLGHTIYCKSVILTSGTFLNGKIHIGEKNFGGGRIAEKNSTGITEQLVELGFESNRLKTGTPPRIDGRSLNYEAMELQEGDKQITGFSYLNIPKIEASKQLPCHITYTNAAVHESLKKGFDKSPMFAGRIEGRGPRYCPSIEDKINRFAERDRHQIFVEPEGFNTVEIYVNGFSTSLPEEIQYEAIRKMPGFEQAKMFRPGYAIEYDYFPPTQLKHSLETKLIDNLFFAGQINGTTGYEEAACQGIMAGINAHLKIIDNQSFILNRDEAYIGVLIDDLISKGTDEPYRMFTSRAEFRTLLRQDNADLRLTEKSYRMGLASQERMNKVIEKRDAVLNIKSLLQNITLSPDEVNTYLQKVGSSAIEEKQKALKLLLRPDVALTEMIKHIDAISMHLKTFPKDSIEQAEIQVKYERYIEKEQELANRMSTMENILIPDTFNYDKISALSAEALQKFKKIKPRTLGQASRISGVNPSDVQILMVYMGR
ncbi:MAG: tRNA uridine-5-carboxymethylaminomethyl(34) synthesis enzyme MnmG [Bacteroidetes bacterium]|nr:tRNA uridine-5-carboxymethylaminomethyl(34) synthesis enzyme MnmG [Bacteroidota bacterium]